MIINQVVSGGGINLEDFNIYKIDPSSITITPPTGVVSNVTSANIYFCTSPMGDAADYHFTIVGPVELLDSNGGVVGKYQVDWVQDNYPNQGDIQISLSDGISVDGWVVDVTGCNTVMEDDFDGDWGSVITGWTTPKQNS